MFACIPQQDKQQAAWYDGASLMQEDHDNGHWDLDRESRGRRPSARSSLKGSSEQAELDNIDGMLCVSPLYRVTAMPYVFMTSNTSIHCIFHELL